MWGKPRSCGLKTLGDGTLTLLSMALELHSLLGLSLGYTRKAVIGMILVALGITLTELKDMDVSFPCSLGTSLSDTKAFCTNIYSSKITTQEKMLPRYFRVSIGVGKG